MIAGCLILLKYINKIIKAVITALKDSILRNKLKTNEISKDRTLNRSSFEYLVCDLQRTVAVRNDAVSLLQPFTCCNSCTFISRVDPANLAWLIWKLNAIMFTDLPARVRQDKLLNYTYYLLRRCVLVYYLRHCALDYLRVTIDVLIIESDHVVWDSLSCLINYYHR